MEDQKLGKGTAQIRKCSSRFFIDVLKRSEKEQRSHLLEIDIHKRYYSQNDKRIFLQFKENNGELVQIFELASGKYRKLTNNFNDYWGFSKDLTGND